MEEHKKRQEKKWNIIGRKLEEKQDSYGRSKRDINEKKETKRE